MEKIDGIDLAEVMASVRDDRLSDMRLAVAKAINGIYNNIHAWSREAARADELAAKRRDQISKAQARLDKLKAGDWSVLPEEKEKEQAHGIDAKTVEGT